MRPLLLAVLISGVFALGVQTQTQRPIPREPMIQKTTVGSELFKFYCSNCHGLDGRGGPAASPMHPPAADLTTLSQNNAGIFPRDQVRDIIVHGAGRGEAHGSRDMPVWGTIFRALEPSDALVEIRVDNLVRYIESLQARGVQTGDAH